MSNLDASSGPPGTHVVVARGHQVRLLLVEVLPPAVVALLLLPFVIAYSHWWPKAPNTIDLQVYVAAVKDMLVGKDIFLTSTPGWNLFFIYPPISAVLMVPLAFGPYLFWQLAWTIAGVGATQSVLRRCGVPRGWKLALVGSVALVAVEPIRTTLGYGQVNTFLMALVVADLLPRWPGAPQHKRPLQGVLVGLATSVKLTPALFGVFALLAGKRRVAIVSGLSFFVVHRRGLPVPARATPSSTSAASPAATPVRRPRPSTSATRTCWASSTAWSTPAGPRRWSASASPGSSPCWGRSSPCSGGATASGCSPSRSSGSAPTSPRRCPGRTTTCGSCPWASPC